MAMIPAEPGGSASSIFSPIPACTRLRANLPASPPTAAPTAVAASSGGAKRPDHEADAAADLGALAAEVVAGLLDVHLAVGVLGDEDDAVGRDRLLLGELHEGVEVLLREIGDQVDRDQDVQRSFVTHAFLLSPCP